MDQHNDRTHGRTGEKATGADEVADYLELEEHLQMLQAGRRPRRPRRMTPGKAAAYQMAALFRAAAPGAAEPDPAFAVRLRAQIEQEVRRQGTGRRVFPAPRVSRRGLLAGGLTAAAAAAGFAVGLNQERFTPGHPTQPPLVRNGEWVAIVSADALPVGGVRRFATDLLVGFVRHTPTGFEALSGACTHMGCLVSWNAGARTFDCPCHSGRFLESGQPAPSSPIAYRPLPSVRTKVEAGQVWIYAPASQSATPTDTSDGGTLYPHPGSQDPTP